MKPWVWLDKILWRFMRWATGYSVRPLTAIGITPNQLTFFSSVINFFLAAICFAQGTYKWSLLALFFLILHSYFDFADGTLARATGQTSELGGWLDPKLDVIGAEVVMLGIIYGVVRSNPGSFWIMVIVLAAISRLALLSLVFDYRSAVYQDTQFVDQFRKDKKMGLIDWLIKEFIALESFVFLFLGTFRYFLPLMIILNKLNWFLLISAFFNTIRWLVMFWAYALALSRPRPSLRVIRLLRKFIIRE